MNDLSVLTEKSLGGLPVLPASETPFQFNMLIYGRSGVGKTLLAGSAADLELFSPVLVLDVEGGALTLRHKYPDVDIVRVKSWKDIQTVYEELYDGNAPYNTIVIDSLTEIQKFSMYNIMLELTTQEPDRDPDIPSIREWGKNIEQTRRFVRAFRDLPINTIFTALEMKDKLSTGGFETKPQLSGKLANEITGMLDEVYYYYIRLYQGEFTRMLLTSGTEQQVAKSRVDLLPTVVENPTMAELFSYINGDKQKEDQT